MEYETNSSLATDGTTVFPPLISALDLYTESATDYITSKIIDNVEKSTKKKKKKAKKGKVAIKKVKINGDSGAHGDQIALKSIHPSSEKKPIKLLKTLENSTITTNNNLAEEDSIFTSNDINNMTTINIADSVDNTDSLNGHEHLTMFPSPPVSSKQQFYNNYISSSQQVNKDNSLNPVRTPTRSGRKYRPSSTNQHDKTSTIYSPSHERPFSPTSPVYPSQTGQNNIQDFSFNKALESIAALKLHNYAMKRRNQITQKAKLLEEIRSFERENQSELQSVYTQKLNEVIAAWKIRYYIEHYRRRETIRECHLLREGSDHLDRVNLEYQEKVDQLVKTILDQEQRYHQLLTEMNQLKILEDDQQHRLTSQSQEINNQSTTIEQLEKEKKRLSALLQKSSHQKEVYQQELQITRDTCQELVQKNLHYQQQCQHLEKQVQQLTSDYENEIYQKQQELLTLQDSIYQLNNQLELETDRVQKLDTQKLDLQKELQQLQQLQEELNEQNHQLTAEKLTSQHTLTRVEGEKESLQRVVVDLARQIDQQREKILEQSKQLAECQEIQQFQLEEIHTRSLRTKESEEVSTAREHQVESLKEELRVITERMEVLLTERETLTKEIQEREKTHERAVKYAHLLEEEVYHLRRQPQLQHPHQQQESQSDHPVTPPHYPVYPLSTHRQIASSQLQVRPVETTTTTQVVEAAGQVENEDDPDDGLLYFNTSLEISPALFDYPSEDSREQARVTTTTVVPTANGRAASGNAGQVTSSSQFEGKLMEFLQVFEKKLQVIDQTTTHLQHLLDHRNTTTNNNNTSTPAVVLNNDNYDNIIDNVNNNSNRGSFINTPITTSRGTRRHSKWLTSTTNTNTNTTGADTATPTYQPDIINNINNNNNNNNNINDDNINTTTTANIDDDKNNHNSTEGQIPASAVSRRESTFHRGGATYLHFSKAEFIREHIALEELFLHYQREIDGYAGEIGRLLREIQSVRLQEEDLQREVRNYSKNYQLFAKLQQHEQQQLLAELTSQSITSQPAGYQETSISNNSNNHNNNNNNNNTSTTTDEELLSLCLEISSQLTHLRERALPRLEVELSSYTARQLTLQRTLFQLNQDLESNAEEFYQCYQENILDYYPPQLLMVIQQQQQQHPVDDDGHPSIQEHPWMTTSNVSSISNLSSKLDYPNHLMGGVTTANHIQNHPEYPNQHIQLDSPKNWLNSEQMMAVELFQKIKTPDDPLRPQLQLQLQLQQQHQHLQVPQNIPTELSTSSEIQTSTVPTDKLVQETNTTEVVVVRSRGGAREKSLRQQERRLIEELAGHVRTMEGFIRSIGRLGQSLESAQREIIRWYQDFYALVNVNFNQRSNDKLTTTLPRNTTSTSGEVEVDVEVEVSQEELEEQNGKDTAEEVRALLHSCQQSRKFQRLIQQYIQIQDEIQLQQYSLDELHALSVFKSAELLKFHQLLRSMTPSTGDKRTATSTTTTTPAKVSTGAAMDVQVEVEADEEICALVKLVDEIAGRIPKSNYLVDVQEAIQWHPEPFNLSKSSNIEPTIQVEEQAEVEVKTDVVEVNHTASETQVEVKSNQVEVKLQQDENINVMRNNSENSTSSGNDKSAVIHAETAKDLTLPYRRTSAAFIANLLDVDNIQHIQQNIQKDIQQQKARKASLLFVEKIVQQAASSTSTTSKGKNNFNKGKGNATSTSKSNTSSSSKSNNSENNSQKPNSREKNVFAVRSLNNNSNNNTSSSSSNFNNSNNNNSSLTSLATSSRLSPESVIENKPSSAKTKNRNKNNNNNPSNSTSTKSTSSTSTLENARKASIAFMDTILQSANHILNKPTTSTSNPITSTSTNDQIINNGNMQEEVNNVNNQSFTEMINSNGSKFIEDMSSTFQQLQHNIMNIPQHLLQPTQDTATSTADATSTIHENASSTMLSIIPASSDFPQDSQRDLNSNFNINSLTSNNSSTSSFNYPIIIQEKKMDLDAPVDMDKQMDINPPAITHRGGANEVENAMSSTSTTKKKVLKIPMKTLSISQIPTDLDTQNQTASGLDPQNSRFPMLLEEITPNEFDRYQKQYLSIKRDLKIWKKQFIKENGRSPTIEDFEFVSNELKVKIAQKSQLKKMIAVYHQKYSNNDNNNNSQQQDEDD